METPPPPAPPPARVLEPAAAPVVALLARQLRISPDDIEVAQVARADWPDACLGLAAEGEICASVITPGFAVTLVVNDQRYEFRTDESGRRIRLALAPRIETGEALVTWRDSASFSVLVVGTQRVAFGRRGRSLLVCALPVPERARELVGFLSRFAPFYARTPAGEITFRGVGPQRPSATEQRQIAEWARLVSVEAQTGRDTPAPDRALVWRRTGGIAGFCDEVIVSRDGLAMARSCRQPTDEPFATIALDPGDLEKLYRWVDTLQPFTWQSVPDGAVADSLSERLEINGQGAKPVSDPEQDAMLEFAHALARRRLAPGTR